MRFSAGLGIPEAQEGFHLEFRPELWHHKVAKLVMHEVEVGDPTFDGRIFVRTSDPDHAARILAKEGVQSALLALLASVRVNELAGNHVRLGGPMLTVGVRPKGGLSDERVRELQVETAALTLHLRGPVT